MRINRINPEGFRFLCTAMKNMENVRGSSASASGLW